MTNADGEVRGHQVGVRDGLGATYLHQCVSVEESTSVASVAVLSDCALHLNNTREVLLFHHLDNKESNFIVCTENAS